MTKSSLIDGIKTLMPTQPVRIKPPIDGFS